MSHSPNRHEAIRSIPKRRLRSIWRKRSGALVPLFALLLPVVLGMVAFVVELARLRHVRSQLQSTADAGALAGASRLRLTNGSLESSSFSLYGRVDLVRPTVETTVAMNQIAHLGPPPKTIFVVSTNSQNQSDGDIVLGTYSSAGFTPSSTAPNAVKVTVRFEEGHPNGTLPLMFAPFHLSAGTEQTATATATVQRPTLLPFLVYKPQWDSLQAGNGTDQYSVDPETNTVSNGPDGIRETTVFPNDWDGLDMPSGNFGWFQIGPEASNSTIIRQLDGGPSQADMNYHGGRLSEGDFVSGITGWRASTEVGLVGGTRNGITYSGNIGQPRVIALYDYATGNGSDAQFRIRKFVLGRVVYADLTGGNAGITIQAITPEQDPNRVRLVD
jgi:Flp pilus assembly protein TadG